MVREEMRGGREKHKLSKTEDAAGSKYKKNKEQKAKKRRKKNPRKDIGKIRENEERVVAACKCVSGCVSVDVHVFI